MLSLGTSASPSSRPLRLPPCPRPALQWAFVASCLVGPLCWPNGYLPKPGPAGELTAAWPALSLPTDLPLVHADALEFSTVWHYAPGEIRQRLLYLHEFSVSRLTRDPVPEHAIQFAITVFPYRSEPYADFVTSHSAFLMLSTGDRLREWQLETLRTLPHHTLYRVSPPSPYLRTNHPRLDQSLPKRDGRPRLVHVPRRSRRPCPGRRQRPQRHPYRHDAQRRTQASQPQCLWVMLPAVVPLGPGTPSGAPPKPAYVPPAGGA